MLELKELCILTNLVQHEIEYEVDNRKYELTIRDDKIKELEILRNKLIKKYNRKLANERRKYYEENKKQDDIRR